MFDGRTRTDSRYRVGRWPWVVVSLLLALPFGCGAGSAEPTGDQSVVAEAQGDEAVVAEPRGDQSDVAAPLGDRAVVADPLAASNWGQWRGPLATGVAPLGDPPIEWSESKNVRWKVALPGKGHSTPIVWGDRVFVTAAIPTRENDQPRRPDRPGAHDNSPITHYQQFVVYALSRGDGSFLWETTIDETLPVEGGHETGSFASASPATDGEVVIASFGSYGLYALDLDGNLLWSADLGPMHTKHGHGEGSSPVLHGDTVAVNHDHEGDSFVVAFDKRTGEERWRVARDEGTSWATPIVVEHGAVAAGGLAADSGSATGSGSPAEGDSAVVTPQLIVPGTKSMRSYDLRTGAVLWSCGGLASNICASPVHSNGIVVAGSSYEKKAMIAVALDGASGDVTGRPNQLWLRTRGTPYVPSPLLYGETLYFLAHYQNVLARADLRTGENDGGPLRLNGLRNVYASPVGAAGRIYVTDLAGATIVLTHEREPKTLAVNRLDDPVSASAAIVGRALFLRGENFLYCIAEEPEVPPARH